MQNNSSNIMLPETPVNGTASNNYTPTEEDFATSKKTRGLDHEYVAAEIIVLAALSTLSLYLLAVSTWYLKKFGQPNLVYTNRICCVSAVLLLLECLFFELEEYLPVVTSSFCTAYTVVNVLVAIGNRTLIYIVLWLRQNSLYSNRLQKLRTRTISVLSTGTLVGISVFGFVEILVLASVPQYAEENVCHSAEATMAQRVLMPVTFCVSSCFQIVLFALTFYPVASHTCGTKNSFKNEKLKMLLLRLSICTFVCILGDLIFICLAANKPEFAEYSFIPICSAFNTGVHMIAMVFSFADYKFRLWPFFRTVKDSNSPQPSASGTEALSKNNIL